MSSRFTALGIGIATSLTGVFLGTIVTFHHRSFAPFGLIIGLILVATWGMGLRIVGHDRALAFVGLLGVLAAQLLLSAGVGGSFVVIAEPLGYTLTLGVALIAMVVLAWPRVPAVSRYDGSSREGD